MFPSEHDVEEFKAQFGSDSVLHRIPLSHLGCDGLQAAAMITPAPTKAETLEIAWTLVRSVARWVLPQAADHPTVGRFEIIVGWSQSVRKMQGQIFKTGGDQDTVRAIAACENWSQYPSALQQSWEKAAFDARVVSKAVAAD